MPVLLWCYARLSTAAEDLLASRGALSSEVLQNLGEQEEQYPPINPIFYGCHAHRRVACLLNKAGERAGAVSLLS